jgi:nitrite reductase (NO-forming)
MTSRQYVIAAGLGLSLGCSTSTPVLPPAPTKAVPAKADEPLEGQETATLASPPHVPPPITRAHPTTVVVHLEVRELESHLAGDADYTFWTFGGTVPGSFIRVRQGDLVEFHLDNHPGNKMPHNIDLHAVIGPGGGAASSVTAPGHSSVFSFKTLHPGLYVYHCGTAPVAMHVANGMYGLILVEPPEGLPKVDHEYYVMQGEFYTQGEAGQPGLQTFSMDKVLHEAPDYIVFNGSEGALLGSNALQANVGETVRLFVGNGGPNLTSSFHIIGEIFDRVWPNGSMSIPQTNVQTISIPPGDAAIVELTVRVPGTYFLVDHALERAFNRGALGQLKATGPEDPLVYSGKIRDEVYLPEGTGMRVASGPAPAAPPVKTKAERLALGEHVFKTNCMACHQVDGKGLRSAFPPLAGSDYLNAADKPRLIRTVTGGLQDKIVVNGQTFQGVMPAWHLSDDEIASVLTFVTNSWGNAGKDVTPAEVAANRVGESPTRTATGRPWLVR